MHAERRSNVAVQVKREALFLCYPLGYGEGRERVERWRADAQAKPAAEIGDDDVA
jgi:hypothetical protein